MLAAPLRPGVASYSAPDWLAERVGTDPFTWRVVALDPESDPIPATGWRTARIGSAEEGELEREDP